MLNSSHANARQRAVKNRSIGKINASADSLIQKNNNPHPAAGRTRHIFPGFDIALQLEPEEQGRVE